MLIRGMHDRDAVLNARLAVLEKIKNLGKHTLDQSHPWEEGVLDYRCDHGCIPSFQV